MKLIFVDTVHLSKIVPDGAGMPIIFIKPDSCIMRTNKPFFYPDFSKHISAHLCVVFRIGHVGKCIAPQYALEYVDGVTVGFDITAEDILKTCIAHGKPWEQAKAFDGAAPVGEVLTEKEYDSLNDIPVSVSKNGGGVLQGSTSSLPFSVAEIISFVSETMTLRTGDLLFVKIPHCSYDIAVPDTLIGCIRGRELLHIRIK